MPEQGNGKRSRKSRLGHYMAITGAAPDMPQVDYGRHLIQWLAEARTVQMGANGYLPLSFAEIVAWSSGTGRNCTWWEIDTMAKMSETYAAWSARAIRADCESPFEPDERTESEKIRDSYKTVDTKGLKRG